MEDAKIIQVQSQVLPIIFETHCHKLKIYLKEGQLKKQLVVSEK